MRLEWPDARFVAGGTDVLPHVHDRTSRPSALISLRRVRELDGIEVDSAGVTRLGGLTRVADITSNAALADRLPTLVQAARRLGSVQIRNVATVGGNLCNASPCADLAPPLLVYDARVQIEGPHGSRELSLEEFFVGNRRTRLEPGEVLVALMIDTPVAGTVSRFDKIGRVRMDLALVSSAVLLREDSGQIAHARIAMGSVGPRPLRLTDVERFLVGKSAGARTAHEAGALASRSVTPIDDVRATAAYRRHVAGVLVERAVRELTAGGAG